MRSLREAPAGLLMGVALVLVSGATAIEDDISTNIRGEEFISRCLELRNYRGDFSCNGTLCHKSVGGAGVHLKLEVSQLSGLTCASQADCSTHLSGLSCTGGGTCLCPAFSAFNITSCSCEPTGSCISGEEGCYKHNEKQCKDKFCSCSFSPNFRDFLIDTPSMFCLLPGAGYYTDQSVYSAPIYAGVWVVVALLLAVSLALAVLTLYQYGAFHHVLGLFQKGDYECENQETVDGPEVHNATWDYPSMDYINRHDEEIVFTLAQAKDFVGASNASTIHVIDENQTYEMSELTENHVNKAYVVEGSVESVVVDDPRND